jgi:cysteine desulfurase
VTEAAEHGVRSGGRLHHAPVDRHGVVDVAQLRSMLTENTRLVSVMLGNNETGVVQPVAEIAKICRPQGILVHVDAVQAAGKYPVDFRQLDVDAVTISAHKFHGPIGVGGLLVRSGVGLAPILWGGFQQSGLRPGTESVTLVLGMWRALQWWRDDDADRHLRLARLRDRLADQLRAGYRTLVVNSEGAARLPHILNVSFPGIDRQALVMALDRALVACSTGSACASGSSAPSPVLRAMGLSEEVISSSVRFSLSAFTTESEVEQAAARILSVVNDLRRLPRTRSAPLPPRVPAPKAI